jgi:hypothetical protein
MFCEKEFGMEYKAEVLNMGKRLISFTTEGFEAVIPASNRPETHILDGAATRIGYMLTWLLHKV